MLLVVVLCINCYLFRSGQQEPPQRFFTQRFEHARLGHKLETLDVYNLRYPPKHWAFVTDYMDTTEELLSKQWSIRRVPGVHASPGTQGYHQGWGETFCFEHGVSYFHASREFQNLLKAPSGQGGAQRTYHLEDRVTIHLRMGDIQNLLVPATYAQILHNIERIHHISIQPEQARFVYYLSASSTNQGFDTVRSRG
ncbi:hypothetical protein BGZ82_000310 [Podila clonocystis]|nr:hypothetical protein BGZ82_000310 [Podila clonocystis]